jgi:uncharacterized protein YggE
MWWFDCGSSKEQLVGNDAGAEMSVEHSQRTISVTGVGRVKASADILVLSFAVETQDVTASEALTKNNQQVSAVLSACRTMGSRKGISKRLNSASIQ